MGIIPNRPDLKNKTVLTVVFVKIRFIQISSGTKNPRSGKLSKASPTTKDQLPEMSRRILEKTSKLQLFKS